MSDAIRRVASRIRLRPEKRELYLQLHAAVWPEVLATLTSVGIRNYSIFLEGDDLFSYYEFEGDDLDAAHRTIAADPSTQAWWRLTDPCQERLPGTPDGQQWLDMVEVFHHR